MDRIGVPEAWLLADPLEPGVDRSWRSESPDAEAGGRGLSVEKVDAEGNVEPRAVAG